MAEIISILNRKGGVGKTTTSINLGKALSLDGYKVLVIDNDPQANLTEGLDIEIEYEDGKRITPTIYDVYKSGLSMPIVEVDENFHAVPSSSDLDAIELEINTDFNRNFKIAEALNPVSPLYDYIFIDCPPSLGVYTQNALTASTKYIIPTKCSSKFAHSGITEAKALIDNEVKRIINPRIEPLGIVLTFYDKRTRVDRAVEADLIESYAGEVFDTRIKQLTKIPEAEYVSLDIFEHASTSEAAEDYRSLAREVAQRIEQNG
ncbi:MAG: chromosome partitioning protein ParA [Thalassobius sp.]|nr:chromosome partitioning protein ParA [Thalassovita sp.]